MSPKKTEPTEEPKEPIVGPNIYQRMLAMMDEVQYLQKEYNKNLKFSVVSHDEVTQAIRKAAIKHGVFIHVTTMECDTEIIERPSKYDPDRKVSYTDVQIMVSFINVDSPEDCTTSRFHGAGEGSDNKTPGIAYSFAIKTAMLKMFMIPTGEIEEEAHLEKHMTDEDRADVEKQKEQNAKDALAVRIKKSDDMLKQLCDEQGYQLHSVIAWIEKMNNRKWVDMDMNWRTKTYKQVKRDYTAETPADQG